MSDGAAAMVAAPPVAGQFLGSFKDDPPSQRPSNCSIDQLMEKVERSFQSRP